MRRFESCRGHQCNAGSLDFSLFEYEEGSSEGTDFFRLGACLSYAPIRSIHPREETAVPPAK